MKDYEVVTEKDSNGNVIKATIVEKKEVKKSKISTNNKA